MAKKQDIKITELEAKVTDLDNQLKRAVADYRNLEQRISQGRSELTNFVGGELIKRLLPVLDHLEQSLSGISEEEKQSGWVKGVELAVKEFNQVLQSEGLGEIPADGVFDPSLHEAVDTREPSSAEASAGKGDNSILEVVRKGYNLNGKVLRPAQVVVGRSHSGDEQKNVTLGSPGTESGVNSATPESEDSGPASQGEQARMTEEEKGDQTSS